MRLLCPNYVLLLSLCCFSLFLSFSTRAQTNDALATEFIPIPQRKKEIVEQLNTAVIKQPAQPRRIIEVQEIDKSEEFTPIPKRKKSVDKEPRNIEEPRKIKNETSTDSKKNELVITEIVNSIRDKLTKCWNIPESIAYKENFSIKINLLLSTQGEIVIADVVDSNSYKNNPLFRSIADSAMRAVYKCSPLTGLPAEHYHIWREVTLDFIPNG
ncbi:hypothetical protein [Candidatus Wolbachia massiliensis]|uniref:Uncharacterized protein n=1 Tax=Candidatus Wolbachia massiliensis TaxID=1845000 RepID=A0A7L7YPJ8_9RICK|nr:hypothetical protein [Candidatus Wolbachia massiliensis]QOD37985.1 hypothetical protein ID128_04025 [Candidatus Wolbachia massiliensis]